MLPPASMKNMFGSRVNMKSMYTHSHTCIYIKHNAWLWSSAIIVTHVYILNTMHGYGARQS